MKIIDVKTYIVLGTSIFVRVFTDEGLSGVGECSPMNCQVIANFIETTLKPMLIGKNSLEIEKLWNEMFFNTYKQGVQGIQPEAIAGIDIALWDIKGKKCNLPIYTLLGGAYQKKYQQYASIGFGAYQSIRKMVKRVEQKLEEGFRAFKIRMDWGSMRRDKNLMKDFEMFKAVRSILDKGIPLSFDANNGYSVQGAIKQGRKFEELDIFHFEEPVAQYDYEGLKKVVKALDVPISAGEHEYTKWQFLDLIQKAQVDIIQPDVVKCAGITEMRRINDLGIIFNKTILPHQTQPTIGNLANLHICASTMNCTLPLEYAGGKPFLEDLFIGLPKIENGRIKLPTKPGLGIEVDEEIFNELKLKGKIKQGKL
ncbi:MAG: mandelate racemase/muconate lactonizing enzyme family protein [Promethearchaeota archaeon]|nr:MAG: mandelate racemase/muconate lactonizing enzyme family protein [Candidatus Lokiarchaeota archaeon]